MVLPPRVIVVLSAVNESIATFCGVGAFTVTVTCAVTGPPVPVAVRMYVVVDVGDTLRLPSTATEPML